MEVVVRDGEVAGPDDRRGTVDLAATDANGLPVFAADGTDLSVIRWMLALSPDDRLRWLENHLRAVAKIGHVQPRP